MHSEAPSIPIFPNHLRHSLIASSLRCRRSTPYIATGNWFGNGGIIVESSQEVGTLLGSCSYYSLEMSLCICTYASDSLAQLQCSILNLNADLVFSGPHN